MDSSSRLSDKAVQKVVGKFAAILDPAENVRYVGSCTNIIPALSHFLITDTRIIGVEQSTVRFTHHGSRIERVDLDAAKGRVTLNTTSSEPFTIKGIPPGDIPDIEGHLARLQARSRSTDDIPGPAAAATAPTAVSTTPPPPSDARPVVVADSNPDDAAAPSGVFSYNVVLTATGSSPIPLIKEVRRLTKLDLASAKRAVEGPPWTVVERLDATSAEQVKAALVKAGATVELVASTQPPLDPPKGLQGLADMAGSAGAGISAERHCGGDLRSAALRAIREVSQPGETPWLVLNPSGATGVLVAFEDRLAIIKTGALTGFLAGATFGGRQAVIYFHDINGIEYNAGLMTGVLEVLTASYQGTANKDFWQGTLSSRNADANDPFTLSNTLPLSKSEYRQCQEHITELRRRIAESKRPVAAAAPAMSAPDSFADQIAKLAQLRADGLITNEEFAAAKQKLMTD